VISNRFSLAGPSPIAAELNLILPEFPVIRQICRQGFTNLYGRSAALAGSFDGYTPPEDCEKIAP